MRVGPVAPGRDDPGIYIEVYRAPLNSRLHGSVAQGIEQRFPKPCVGCSNHLGATSDRSRLLIAGYCELIRANAMKSRFHNALSSDCTMV